MGIKCPKCHSDNPDTKRFCGECGTQIIPKEEIPVTETIITPKEELTRGTTLAGRYEIIEELGRGGMGKVYRVEDKKIKEEVALKLLKHEIASDKKTIERFSNELKVARKIAHRNVCKMYDLGEEKGTHYITMEYVPGEDLKRLIRKIGQFSAGKTIFIAKQVCEGLAEAHRLGVVHRDLKPQNIMVDEDGNARIMDFGIARSIRGKGITGAGVMIGTPEYMSPEQAEVKDVDQRSDIYSLGVILYEMVTGKVPFEGETPLGIAMKHKSEMPPNPREFNAQIPEELSRVILRCMEKNKEKRYQDAGELHSELSRIEEGIPTTEREIQKKKPLTSREITLKFNLRRIIIPSLVFVALVVIAVITLKFVNQSKIGSIKKETKAVSVLIADFENQTGEPIFDDTIEQALALGITRFSFIKSYSRTSAKKVANQLDPDSKGKLDIKMAQIICRRTGINFVITGTIQPLEKGYSIKTWALYPDKTDKVFEISKDISSKDDILKATNKLAHSIASNVGNVKIRSSYKVTTNSIEALKAYSRAVSFDAQSKVEEAIQEYLQAIEEDPDFGKAYTNVASLYYNLGMIEKAKEYYEKALARMDRMTEDEKHSARCKYYLIVRNYDKAIKSFNEYLKLNPKNYWALANLALAYFFAREMSHAVDKQKTALEIYPTSISGRYNLIWYLIGAGGFEEAEKEARAIVNLNPEYTKAFVTLALIEVIQGRVSKAKETYQELKKQGTLGASLACFGLADLALYEGRLNDAEQILKEGIVVDLKEEKRDFAGEKLLMLAQTYLLQGRKSLARETIERALNESNKESVLYSAAQIYIDADDGEKAKALLKKMKKVIYPEYQSYCKLLEGEMKLKKSEISGALKSFQDGQRILNTWISQYNLGRVYLEAGAFTEAHEAFELCLKRRGEATSVFFDDLPTIRYLPNIYYYLARALEGLNSPKASETYNTFLSIKGKSEGEPLVVDARQRLLSFEMK